MKNYLGLSWVTNKYSFEKVPPKNITCPKSKCRFFLAPRMHLEKGTFKEVKGKSLEKCRFRKSIPLLSKGLDGTRIY